MFLEINLAKYQTSNYQDQLFAPAIKAMIERIIDQFKAERLNEQVWTISELCYNEHATKPDDWLYEAEVTEIKKDSYSLSNDPSQRVIQYGDDLTFTMTISGQLVISWLSYDVGQDSYEYVDVPTIRAGISAQKNR